ncbi:MBL fold metallo-hydrolase [Patescibacteria group bacterium]|nr:MBL fold metallo-hydrolase [Patescibacteria group bacterium]
MEILFLGTSSGWPLPRLGCKCHICSSDSPKDKRSRPSILINKSILIDAPPDIYTELKNHKVDPTKITHILLTHAHDDHIMGLFDLSHIYEKPGKVKLISTPGVLAHTRKKMRISLFAFETIEVKPFEKVRVGNDSYCWFIEVVHTVEAYGIKIKAPKPVLYAPEFRKIYRSNRKQLGDLDLAIIDGSSKTRTGQARGHETIEEGIRLGTNIRAKKVLFTNIGHKTDTHDELVRFVKEKGGNRFDIAFDGLIAKL